MKLQALKDFSYGGAWRRAGDQFTAVSAQDARTLQAIGKAKPVEAAPAAPKVPVRKVEPATYRRKDMTADAPSAKKADD